MTPPLRPLLSVVLCATAVGCGRHGDESRVLADLPPGTLVVRDAAGRDHGGIALVVTLHDRGEDEGHVATMMSIDPGFAHVHLAPRGFVPLGGDDGRFAWFAADGPLPTSNAAVDGFLDAFDAYLATAVEASGADRVYVVGYGQGGSAAILLSMARPNAADAYISIAGDVIDVAWMRSADPRRHWKSKLLVLHGTADVGVPSAEFRRDLRELYEDGRTFEYREYPAATTISAAQLDDAERWLMRVDTELYNQRKTHR